MLLAIGVLGAFILWSGRRAAVANNNLVFSIVGFRVHKVSITNIEFIVKLAITNASNQDYTISKAFFIVKYPKGGLSSGNIGNTLASFESLQNLFIKARQNIEADARVNISTLKLSSVIKEYFTSTSKMTGEVTGTISLSQNSNGINLIPVDFDVREAFNGVKSQVQGVLSFLYG